MGRTLHIRGQMRALVIETWKDLSHFLSQPATRTGLSRTAGVVEPPASPKTPPGPSRGQESQTEGAMFDLVWRSNQSELFYQFQQAVGNQDATATFKDGLAALSAYMMFVLHSLDNDLTTANLHNWPIISHASLRHLSGWQAFASTVSRPWGDICEFEVAEVVKFLVCRFTRPRSVAIGEREIGLLAKALLASKAPYQHMFVLGTQEYAISEEAVHIWEFPVQYFTGPPWSPNQWYVWGHGGSHPPRPRWDTDCRPGLSLKCGRCRHPFRKRLLQFAKHSRGAI